ncbi:PREDICTED: coiled-coil domain-containing protein 33 [Sturnus vulgaris]|uniref:coiled-coil domain-containing protein 33 n=1 Tax=Sturnus vulgaris TaxID=9172 RepID=UPI00071A3A66|nr:PREDICTED: coiled-coil domain-containing protein 33 [Sturnus vulgaris]
MSLPAPDAMDIVLLGLEPAQSSQESIGEPQETGVARYRLALQRMAGDLLCLRRRVASLEAENGHLRDSLARLREPALLRDTNMDVLSREELLDRLATLERELAAGTAESRELRDRVQRLQNELIRKNDREKELVLLQRCHRQQQVTLRRCQDRVAKARALGQALRQQEKVIEAMERLLREKPGRSTERAAGDSLGGDALVALLAENRRLREELELARPPRAVATAVPGVQGGTEKLWLLARLEEAQARGRVLERQLEEAARRWGRERQELGTRLLEREHGLPPAPKLPAIPVSPRRPPQALPPLP